MRNSIIFTLLIMFISAQVDGQVSLGIRGGLNLSDYEAGSRPEGLRMPLLPSPAIGGFLNFRTGKHFSIQTEVNFSPLGRQFRSIEGDMREVTRIQYLNSNLLANFSVGSKSLRFYGEVGPYAGYALWGRTSWDYRNVEPLDDGTRNIDFEDDNLERYDFGLLVGMGIKLMVGPGYTFLDGRIGHGFADLRRREVEGTRPWYNRFLNFSTGYVWPIGN
ncbi:porin family protein [Cytophagaceae bacterium ABcell3]|nr:porin family protein [Cytophagaceae bacterium ABcell3]